MRARLDHERFANRRRAGKAVVRVRAEHDVDAGNVLRDLQMLRKAKVREHDNEIHPIVMTKWLATPTTATRRPPTSFTIVG